MTKAIIKLIENGTEVLVYYGHDGGPESLGKRLGDYLKELSDWPAFYVLADMINGRMTRKVDGKECGDYDFVPTSQMSGYEEYGYVIDCSEQTLTCYDLPGYPKSEHYEDGYDLSAGTDWSRFPALEIPEWGRLHQVEDRNLPSHIVERCKYVAMTMDSTDMTYCHVDPAEQLKVPVERVRWNYPFEVKGSGDFNVYHIEKAKTWGELLTRIVEVFQREYDNDERVHFHELGDYIIEPLEIHPNGLATVYFGS